MEGKIDWSALPVVVELLGIIDIEQLLSDLMVIRQFKAEKKNG